MKKLIVIAFVAATLTACRTGYDITLSNGMKITGVSKPVLDRQSNLYSFKDANGQVNSIPASRVSVIEPTGSSKENRFNKTEIRPLKR